MRHRLLFRKAKRIYYEKGALALATEAKNFAIDTSKGSYQGNRRIDNDERYSMIEAHISEEDQSLLDIGCAEGELTHRFSEDGLFSIGLDGSATRISHARKGHESNQGPGFLFYEIEPKNVNKLPSFDVILLLTVIHHWYRAFGWETAEEMLRDTGRKSNKLFFEPPGWELERPPINEVDGKSIQEYYATYLDIVFDGDVDFKFLGEASYTGGGRVDPIFLIDCSDYH